MEKENEKHYESLLSYFKNLVWIVGVAITLLTGAAIFVTWDSISDMKKEVSGLKTEALVIINQTKENFDLQLEGIQNRAENTALKEAKLIVRSTLSDKDIESIIKNEIESVTGYYLRERIESESNKALKKVNNEISSLVKVFDASVRMRIGLKNGYLKLLEYSQDRKDAATSLKATSLLDIITEDFENVYSQNFNVSRKKIKDLLKIIREDSLLDDIAIAFFDLRAKTGVNFRMFDFNAVEEWCRKNKDLCK